MGNVYQCPKSDCRRKQHYEDTTDDKKCVGCHTPLNSLHIVDEDAHFNRR